MCQRSQYPFVGWNPWQLIWLYICRQCHRVGVFFEDPFASYMFAFWRKISENLSIILHYGLDLTVNGLFLEGDSERVNCLLEWARITFYKIGKEVFTEGCKSPSSFTSFRFRISCRSITRRRDIRDRRNARRVTGNSWERKNVFKVNIIPSFNDGVVGYFTNLRVNY